MMARMYSPDCNNPAIMSGEYARMLSAPCSNATSRSRWSGKKSSCATSRKLFHQALVSWPSRANCSSSSSRSSPGSPYSLRRSRTSRVRGIPLPVSSLLIFDCEHSSADAARSTVIPARSRRRRSSIPSLRRGMIGLSAIDRVFPRTRQPKCPPTANILHGGRRASRRAASRVRTQLDHAFVLVTDARCICKKHRQGASPLPTCAMNHCHSNAQRLVPMQKNPTLPEFVDMPESGGFTHLADGFTRPLLGNGREEPYGADATCTTQDSSRISRNTSTADTPRGRPTVGVANKANWTH